MENEPDIVARLTWLSAKMRESSSSSEVKDEAELLLEAAKVITWGRRRDDVFVECLQQFRLEFFTLAVEVSTQADSMQLLNRRQELRKMEAQVKTKVAYIEKILSYTGEEDLGAPTPPRTLN